MKKTVSIVIALCVMASMFAGCESAEAKLEKEVEAAYGQIGSIYFSDENALEPDELVRFNELKQEKERAYREKDVAALNAVNADWENFRIPIQSRIDEIEAERSRLEEEERLREEEEVREKMKTIIELAQSVADVLTAFSFGTLDLSITSRGSSLVYTFKYLIDVPDANAAKAGLEMSVGLFADTYKGFVEEMKSAGIPSPSVVVEYRDKTGSMIYSREFK